jgi:hypothetical protein
MTRAGGEHYRVGLHRDELLGGSLVGLHDLGRMTQPLDQLHEVVREAVVVVDDQDHAPDAIMRPCPTCPARALIVAAGGGNS